MAQRIDVSSGGTQGLMNIVLLLEQLEEGRAQRAAEADERRLEREETRRRYEDEKMAKRRQEMFSMYQSLKDAKNGEKPRYTDKRINEIMTQWYGDEWRGLMPGEAQITPEAKPESFFPKTKPIKQSFKEGGIKDAAGNLGTKVLSGASAIIGGKGAGERTARQLENEGYGGTLDMLMDAGASKLRGREDVPIKDVGASLDQVENMVRLGVEAPEILDNLVAGGLTRGVATEMLRTTFQKMAEKEQPEPEYPGGMLGPTPNIPAIQ